MKVSQFDGFVNNATDEILGVKGINRENLEPMLSTTLSPNITPLIVRRNGVYYPDLGIDGFSPVWVDVDAPTPTPPVINPITITENGTYNKPSGVDGYNPITVNVPSTPPVIQPITITENGTYNKPSGIDGYNPITVNVPSTPPVIQPITITENGTYNKPSGIDGYNPITVNVPSSSGNFAEWDFTKSQSFFDSIKNIEITPSVSSTYSFVNDGIEVLTNGFYMILPMMYASNLTYTIEFSKFENNKSTNIGIMGISGNSSPQSANKGLSYNKASDEYRLNGYQSATSSTTKYMYLTGFTIADGDSISVQLLPNTLWRIRKNGVTFSDSNCSLTPILNTYTNLVFGNNTSNGSFNPGTIIKKVTIS